MAGLFGVAESSITSNARIKRYPSAVVLQVANDNIFRDSGFEPRTRLYSVSAKGKAENPERSLQSSRSRAKAAIRDIALCNRFSHFFTWTLSKDQIDRYDVNLISRKVQTFLKNAVHRKGFQYVLVPEYHKDGAIHFHGLCNLGDIRIERATDARTKLPLSTNRGQPIFNMLDWKLGFSTCIPIDENYERICNYLTKYLTKDSEKILGKWYLASRNLIKRPEIDLISGGIDYDSFIEENPLLPIVPLYRDVAMAIMQQPLDMKEGEAI